MSLLEQRRDLYKRYEKFVKEHPECVVTTVIDLTMADFLFPDYEKIKIKIDVEQEKRKEEEFVNRQ